MATPTVSVCVITYQHARFIKQCVDSILAQKTAFPIEICIGEDESNDGTREICKEYSEKYPDIIRLFLRRREDNLLIDGKPRGGRNLMETLKACAGRYIAFSEGDDYWTDNNKLQIQVEALERDSTLAGCFHNSVVVDDQNNLIDPSYFKLGMTRYSQYDCIATLLSQEATNSIMFRAECVNTIPGWFARRPSDFYLDILIARHGDLAYIARNMSAYRRHAAGNWSKTTRNDQILELWLRYKLLLQDEYFLANYKELIVSKITDMEQMIPSPEELSRLHDIIDEQNRFISLLNERMSSLTDRMNSQDVIINLLNKEMEQKSLESKYTWKLGRIKLFKYVPRRKRGATLT